MWPTAARPGRSCRPSRWSPKARSFFSSRRRHTRYWRDWSSDVCSSDLCQQNGVDNVTEVLLGYDGLSIAHSSSAPDISLTKAQIFEALASEVEVDGEIVANPHKKWSDLDPSLPDSAITVFGPPPTSGTRDAFVELVMQEGCEEFPAIAALDGDRKEEVCGRMRQDGPFIEAGKNDNLIVQRLQSDPSALGIFGYSFLFENEDTLKPVAVDGVAPSPETIADGSYGVSRPLYIRSEEHTSELQSRQYLVC